MGSNSTNCNALGNEKMVLTADLALKRTNQLIILLESFASFVIYRNVVNHFNECSQNAIKIEVVFIALVTK